MTEISFYHLERSSLERALPRLLEKVLASGKRAVVKAGSEERVEALSTALWVYEQGSFLPHGSSRDGYGPDQPVWLTDGDDNPNGASVLILTDATETDRMESFERCLELFDGRDEGTLASVRAHWKAYAQSGHALTYWRQTAAGGWERQEI
ncbi:MAG TPA: DNA polymerase III subunit chi [Alphaproteobacteria bacterium]